MRAGCRRRSRARRRATCSGTGWSRPASSSSWARSAGSDRTCKVSTPGTSSPGTGRCESRTATPSAPSRRVANRSASSDGSSSHCRSSTMHTTGRSSAASESRPSSAAPIASRACGAAGSSCRAPASAAACAAGSRSRRPTTGRHSSASPANGWCASASSPRTRSTVMPSARSSAASSRAVLPIPGCAGQHERGAAARAGGVQRAPDALQLDVTTDQHRGPSLATRSAPLHGR